ncbi:MAG: hypothetical protein QOH95_1668, partial [Gaiellaceae bacterium]|nr:hypothetical protein [Gaiellaceae bacterium]
MQRALLILLLVGIFLTCSVGVADAAGPVAPTGVSAIALDAGVELAWQPVVGASAYVVYRDGTPVTPPAGIATTSFTDTGLANGTSHTYVVRALSGGIESLDSATIQATAVARSCSGGNPVTIENCYPGNTGFLPRAAAQLPTGVEGFATASSIDHGESVDLKISSAATTTVNIEVYRTGWYGGTGARLFSVIRNVPGTTQPACYAPNDATGLIDCANWNVSATLTTTSSWPSGNYLLRIVRNDNGSDNQILLVVRDDGRHPDLVYGTGITTFQAYNAYKGRSLYTYSSFGSNTVAGTPRAVMVSYDRPYEQPRSGARDWYPRTELPTVEWLEHEGYDVGYVADSDLDLHPAFARQGRAYLSPAHDEYWSAGMRTAVEQARDAGVNLFFTGSNESYWKIRFDADPLTGAAGRLQVCYKTVESGGADPDPSGIATTTWRDPAGPNRPENALSGQMYVGDADNTYFPLVVPAQQGADRIWRNTGLERQAAGAAASLGSALIGWEWDARTANGFEPVGVKSLASSPVTGNLSQNNGNGQVAGTATVTMVKYRAASGALVLSTGTNHWNWGLERDPFGAGEPSAVVQQATVNILADMGAQPSTPTAGMVLDSLPVGAAPTGLAVVSTGATTAALSWAPVAGATGYNVYRLLAPREDGLPLGAKANVAAVGGTTFTDTPPSTGTQYFYVVTAVSFAGESATSNEVSATPGGPGSDTTPPTVSVTAPAAGATVSGIVSLTASAADNAVVAGVQLLVDGVPVGTEDVSAPYTASWDTTGTAAGPHSITATARDAAGNRATSAAVTVTVTNGGGGGAATQLFGTQTLQASADSEVAGRSEAFKVTASATGQLATIKVYVDTGSAATKLAAGVYADNAGHPGALLGQGSISLPVAASWNAVTLPATVPVTAGQAYWIALLGTGGTVRFRDCGHCGPASEGSLQTTLSSLPATWTTGGSWLDAPLAAYGLSGAATADTAPPSAPPNARVSGQTTTSLTLAWDASTDNVAVTGYRPYLGTARQSTTSATSFTFTGLTCGTAYTLAVDAVDAAGNVSTKSSIAATTAACVDTGPPTA